MRIHVSSRNFHICKLALFKLELFLYLKKSRCHSGQHSCHSGQQVEYLKMNPLMGIISQTLTVLCCRLQILTVLCSGLQKLTVLCCRLANLRRKKHRKKDGEFPATSVVRLNLKNRIKTQWLINSNICLWNHKKLSLQEF